MLRQYIQEALERANYEIIDDKQVSIFFAVGDTVL